jgi:SAM-dependent methyltransferase
MWPQQGLETPAAHYHPQYYGESENKFSTPGVEKVLDCFRKQRAKKLLRFLPEKGKGSILDVGCGNGTFLHILGKKGDFSLYGSELPGPAADRSRRFPEIQLSTSGAFHEEITPESLDAVTMFHVIEHLPAPLAYLGKISQALKKGGVFYVSFPNIDSWQARLFRDKWLHLDPPRHLVLFHPRAFLDQMEKMGFERIYSNSLSAEQNPFGMVQSLLNRFSEPRDLLFESMKGNTEYLSGASGLRLFIHRIFFILSFPLFVLTDMGAAAFGKGATLTFIFRKGEENN